MTAERKWRQVLAVAVAVALTAAAAACGGSEAKEPAAAAQGPARRVVNVEVEPAAVASFTDRVSLVGVVSANRDVTVAAEEGGVIRALHVDKGAVVQAGQPIAKIDDALLQAQLRQAEADAALARETHERQRRLWEEEKIGTELAYLQAKFAAERAAATASLLAERLERTTVRAPFAGIVDARMVEVGAMVLPGAPVVRMVDIGTVKVMGGVPERFATEIRRGAGAAIVFDALGGRPFQGRIGFVGAVIDPQDRTFPVEVVVANADGAIKPGLVANVTVDRRVHAKAVVVPQQAVLRGENGYLVYIAVEEGGETLARARPVVMGASQAGRVVIESGLAGGEQVIVVGQQKVAPGDLLRIVGKKEGAAQ